MDRKSQAGFTIANFVISGYFLALYSLYVFKIGSGELQFFIELLTIPMMLLMLVFTVLGIVSLLRHQLGLWIKISIAALTICAVLTFGSFFW